MRHFHFFFVTLQYLINNSFAYVLRKISYLGWC